MTPVRSQLEVQIDLNLVGVKQGIILAAVCKHLFFLLNFDAIVQVLNEQYQHNATPTIPSRGSQRPSVEWEMPNFLERTVFVTQLDGHDSRDEQLARGLNNLIYSVSL